jgi:hypothetical protein
LVGLGGQDPLAAQKSGYDECQAMGIFVEKEMTGSLDGHELAAGHRRVDGLGAERRTECCVPG